MQDIYHQIVSIILKFDTPYSSGHLNRQLKELGATLHYDVYSIERKKPCPIWQSESLVFIQTYLNNKQTDAQESCDTLVLEYPLATLGSENISEFANTAENFSRKFNTNLLLNNIIVTKLDIIKHCEELATDLLENFGEEPGSESLAIMIESEYK